MDSLILSLKPTPRTPITPKTPKTPKKHHSKYELDNIPSQNFKIGYQKVTLDVDLEQNCIAGETEITVLPLESSLKTIKLDCRGIQVKSIIVNQRRAHFSYDDFLQNQEYMNDPENPVLSEYKYDKHFDSNSSNISINQHEMIRAKFYPLFSDQNDTGAPSSSYSECTSELTIKVPESIKLRLQDTSKLAFSPIGTNRSMNETPNTANTLLNSEKVYTPLNIKIVYIVKNLKNGIHFNGGIHTSIPKNLWYCYTFNNDFGCSASSWVPCIDNFHEKPAWDINIVVPKTVGDIGQTILIGTKKAEQAFRKSAMQQISNNNLDGTGEGDDDDYENEEDNIEATPLTVVVPDLVSFRESPHPIDVAKKVVNFQFFNPVCAHHLGFAIGCFEKTSIVDVKPGTDELSTNQQNSSTNSDNVSIQFSIDSANSNKVPTMVYHLPGRRDEVINSTMFLYKALEFYSKEFSSFPFTSYTLLFIENLPSKVCTFAGMTLASSNLLYSSKLIEPMFETTELLSVALAEQYSGVNVLPKTLNDIWCTIGIARYMSNQFLKKLFGLNYYNFTFKKRCDLLCELDVGKRPLANQMFRFPINSDQDFEFINLKAPLVLMILDKRITKTDKLFGLSRVIPKIFLQAMSNDLINGNNLSTAQFQRVCEKVAHHKLETFFQNWVHKSGVPIFRITQKFNKKRLFIEMTIRQMQRSSLNNTDSYESSESNDLLLTEKQENFVNDANIFLTEENHFDAQQTFTGPVTVRIHEADGSPYEHILAISEPLTKLDIQYNTKYRRRKKDRRDGTEDIEDKEKNNEKEKEMKKKDKIEEPKVGMLGDVLKSQEELENWGLKEEGADAENGDNDQENQPLPDDDKAEAFDWLRFDVDNEWISKYTINLTDDKFESQLRQDRDVSAQYESVKYFGNITRANLYHARVLLRTLIDDKYYFGVREEAAKSLAKISNEENDHIGMRVLLKAFKYLFCYEGEITKGYNEFDPKEYLPKPNNFSIFTNLFVMRAILSSLSLVRNKDGDAPIELKRILLNILKYNDNSYNKFDDTYYYCNIIVSVCNLILVSKREIFDLNIDYTTKDSDLPQTHNTKDQFINSAIKELNRCLKLDEWCPSYKNNITKVVLEQKIRLTRAGLARMTFMDLLKYTTNTYNDDIRTVAFEGLLILGGLRNSNILNYYFTAMKLDESLFLRYQLNLILIRSLGVAAYSGIPSLLDDEEFLQSVSVNSMDEKSGDNLGNRMIQIEDSTSANVSMQSRKDEIARRSIKGSIDVLRRDLSVGKGLTSELWDALHSCLVPINTRRNIFDIMMVLYDPKDSFIVTTDLPSDKFIAVRVVDKNTNSEIPSDLKFVISLKREAKFKIQLPVLKLKMGNDKGVKQKKSPSHANLALLPPGKKSKKKKLEIGTDPVTIKKTASKFEIKIKLPTKVNPLTATVNNRIIRHDPFSPLRFVRFNLRTKSVQASTNENFTYSNAYSASSPLYTPSYFVSLKINPQKWKSFLEAEKEETKTQTPFLIKLENTTNPASSMMVTEGQSVSETESVSVTIKKETDDNEDILDETVKIPQNIEDVASVITPTVLENKGEQPIENNSIAVTNTSKPASTESRPTLKLSLKGSKSDHPVAGENEGRSKTDPGDEDQRKPSHVIKLKLK